MKTTTKAKKETKAARIARALEMLDRAEANKIEIFELIKVDGVLTVVQTH